MALGSPGSGAPSAGRLLLPTSSPPPTAASQPPICTRETETESTAQSSSAQGRSSSNANPSISLRPGPSMNIPEQHSGVEEAGWVPNFMPLTQASACPAGGAQAGDKPWGPAPLHPRTPGAPPSRLHRARPGRFLFPWPSPAPNPPSGSGPSSTQSYTLRTSSI